MGCLGVIIGDGRVGGDVGGVDGGLLVARTGLGRLATQAGASLGGGRTRRGLDVPDWRQDRLGTGSLELERTRDAVGAGVGLGIGGDGRGPYGGVLRLGRGVVVVVVVVGGGGHDGDGWMDGWDGMRESGRSGAGGGGRGSA